MTEKKDARELAALLRDCPPPGSVWRHVKGGRYLVTGCAIDEATLRPVVIYRPVAVWRTGLKFCRPLTEWDEEVSPGVNRFTRED